MRRLSSLGSKHLKHRKGRYVLTAAGIVLGVAVLFGILIANATTKNGVDALVRDFTGDADVLVRPRGAFDATMPAPTISRLEALQDVLLVVPSHRFDTAVRAPGGEEPVPVTVRGIDLATARRIQPYELARGAFFAPGADEVVIPLQLAGELRVRAGDEIPLGTPYGIRRIRVVGLLADRGAARSDQGNVAFTSLDTSRRLARAGDVLSGARLVLREEVDVDEWLDRTELEGLAFENARELAQGFQQFLDLLGAVFTFFATMTLFVGAFLIYLTLSMAVIERTRVYGTMRALGATRRQIRRVVMTEALALGVISTVLGLLLGLVIAKGFIALFANMFEIRLEGLHVTGPAIAIGTIVGIAVTLGSSLVPARRAARLAPVVAMKGDYAAETRLSRAWIGGLVAFALGVVASLAISGAAGAPLILLGAVLLTPPLLRPVARALGRLTHRIARGVGDVAVLHLVKERSRSAYTLALIMVVMALILSVGGMHATLRRAVEQSIDRQFGADITVHPFSRMSLPTLSEQVEREIAATPGVERLTGLRFGLVAEANDESTFVRIIDPETYFDVASFLFKQGNERDAQRALAAGGAVLLPATRARELGVSVGEKITVLTSSGPRRFRVAATYLALGGPPEIVFGLPDGKRYLNAAAATVFAINVRRDTDVETVRARLQQTVGDRYNLDIDTAGEIKKDALDEFGRFFAIFYAILLVGGVIGLLGLANTLAMSVLQRYREIGILRAVGTSRPQIRRMVLVESATLSLVAFVLALPLGLLLSVLTVNGISDAFGFEVAYVYPASWLPALMVFGGAVAILAAIAPGRRAARLQVVGALQYE